MTKDRRLGRGLAALLGTPVEEGAGEMSPATIPMTGSSSMETARPIPSESLTTPDKASPRADIIKQFASEARGQSPRGTSSPISIPMSPVAASSSAKPASVHPVVNHPDGVQPHQGTIDVATHLIDPNPFQPRRHFNAAEIESLAESLKQHQQLQPVLVRKIGERFQLISGERRLRATIHAGLPSIRAEVREADDRLVAELAIIENLQRKDLNAIEKAMSFKRYISEHKCTQEELASRLKIDRSTIANMMRLLELPEAITDAIQREEITAGHAKALLSLGSTKEQHVYLRRILDHGWSVRETERQVAEAVANAEAAEEGILGMAPRRRASKTSQLQALESELKMTLGTKVEISQSGRGKGRITIHFTSIEEFERLRSMLATDTKRKAA
ncbi:ParB/RepB/Spo0J family partition protein [Pirellula sp. SH-Sr6A]|uniref:ParB/RepB/Spo0J family partition protein n=1 Tax=Pirellula sp. SH-Sr6A TaxID=1632865 RepID=UPI001F0B70C4|nr:ParB/RepB/Spo0J family partition protein [Pirellula sp. SH-Sr6A]